MELAVRRSIALLAVALAAAGAGAFACASEKSDGSSCDSDSDCKSKSCSSGTCAGSACDCASEVCETGTSCESGWVCARDEVASAPRCRKQCKQDSDCLADEHCGDGRCKSGVAPTVLTWKHLPRASPCRAYSECPFEVGVIGGSGVDRYEWTFSDDPDAGVTTQDPKITHKYPPGAAKTEVRVVEKNGNATSLDAVDDICVDGTEIKCVPDAISCCFGSCTASGECH